ncbi:MAG: hypothetical protein AAF191_14025, partial [Verrucomicrobiota bacterium]
EFRRADEFLDEEKIKTDHLFRAMLNQKWAYYDLEKWDLTKTAEKAKEAADAREKLPLIAGLRSETIIAPEEAWNENDRNSCLDYFRCLLLQALAEYYAGNAGDALRTFQEVNSLAKEAEDQNFLDAKAEWQKTLHNTLQRSADYYFFLLGGKEHRALKTLEDCLVYAHGAGHDQPSNNLYFYYLLTKCRSALVKAVMGNLSEARLELEEIRAAETTSERHLLFLEVAEAFAVPKERESLLTEIVLKNLDRAKYKTPDRDDRQLLLFLCEFLLLDFSNQQYETIREAKELFAEPWLPGGNVGTPAFLSLLQSSAYRLKEDMDTREEATRDLELFSEVR